MTLDRYSVPEVDAGEVADEELLVSEDVLLKVFAIGPGGELAAHEHEGSTNVFHVLEGTVTAIQEGEEEEIDAPGVVHHERGASLGARNDTDDIVVLTASLCPMPS
jgi:quercetin dioxygenase-like cupin family protein